MRTENAIIKSTRLGYEDHGIMTFFLTLDYGGSGQGFGGYALADEHGGLASIEAVLKVVGVDNWEDLPGKYVRAEHEMSKVHRIGNVLEDRWLNLSEFFSQYSSKESDSEEEDLR